MSLDLLFVIMTCVTLSAYMVSRQDGPATDSGNVLSSPRVFGTLPRLLGLAARVVDALLELLSCVPAKLLHLLQRGEAKGLMPGCR
ncbi:hypothetical protein O3P69_015389 [Scylla paramamosain]|uniref:Secreted protein n=1 Tax=Scylla paramamosain TaxID=85552 RepID=A0AAW0T4C3_SCYPA